MKEEQRQSLLELQAESYIYHVKCRRCGKETEMWAGKKTQINKDDFLKYINEHSTFPITKQCECNNGMMLFHDVIGYNIIF